MQQTFQCQRCGSQNTIGQRYCTGCGNKFIYNCPQCGGVIDPAHKFCPNCRAELGWGIQQQTQPLPTWGQGETDQQQQRTYRYEGERPKEKKASSSLISCLGLIIGIVLLVGGGIFVANPGFNRTSSSVPSTISEPADSSSVPPETVLPEPEEDLHEQESGCETLPEYVQQYENVQPPYARASGQRIHLVSNPDAKDVSFAELKSFILRDNTDEAAYIERVRKCTDFAETLHNNAERAGIRAAFVGIYFVDEEIGHALNVFCTTDSGLVYVDCGGKEKGDTGGCDTIAYVEAGKEYGVISIDEAQSLQYGYYVEYTQNWQRYKDMLDDYKNEVDAFKRALGGRTTLAEPEYSKFKAWEVELREKGRILYELADEIGDSRFEPLGIVETVKIYW